MKSKTGHSSKTWIYSGTLSLKKISKQELLVKSFSCDEITTFHYWICNVLIKSRSRPEGMWGQCWLLVAAHSKFHIINHPNTVNLFKRSQDFSSPHTFLSCSSFLFSSSDSLVFAFPELLTETILNWLVYSFSNGNDLKEALMQA